MTACDPCLHVSFSFVFFCSEQLSALSRSDSRNRDWRRVSSLRRSAQLGPTGQRRSIRKSVCTCVFFAFCFSLLTFAASFSHCRWWLACHGSIRRCHWLAARLFRWWSTVNVLVLSLAESLCSLALNQFCLGSRLACQYGRKRSSIDSTSRLLIRCSVTFSSQICSMPPLSASLATTSTRRVCSSNRSSTRISFKVAAPISLLPPVSTLPVAATPPPP
jgi:hypothetical protein